MIARTRSFDASYHPFQGPAPTKESIDRRLDSMILSASGWRGVFAASRNEEDKNPDISLEDSYIAAAAAIVQARYLKQKLTLPSVLVATDARPTGGKIAQCAITGFLSEGVCVRFLGEASAPEIMAENLRGAHGCDGFFYISASHNPVGHNGIKFGGQGGVYPGSITGPFALTFKTLLADPLALQAKLSQVSSDCLAKVYNEIPAWKHESLATYQSFVLETSELSLESWRTMLKKRPVGIVCDMNGSARATSIDQALFSLAGIKSRFLNEEEIAHAIVPEGANLDTCKELLKQAHAQDPDFLIGYMPDNDGDRGNIVYWDEEKKDVLVPPAQEVFALIAMATLSEMKQTHPQAKLAIAVNGPTSLIVDRISEKLGAKVFRSEVGEANVVQLAQQVRGQGYLVKVLGEGSNGGTITDPARVRDPMNTIFTLLKLLAEPKILGYWRSVNGLPDGPITLSQAVKSLPRFTTTGAFSKDGVMRVHKAPGDLKKAYEALFLKEFPRLLSQLAPYGITGCTVYQAEGTVTRKGLGESYRHAPYKGGWKACLTNAEGKEIAFIWMRPSGTEPVFRVLADVEGDKPELHDLLLSWHRSMVQKADET